MSPPLFLFPQRPGYLRPPAPGSLSISICPHADVPVPRVIISPWHYFAATGWPPRNLFSVSAASAPEPWPWVLDNACEPTLELHFLPCLRHSSPYSRVAIIVCSVRVAFTAHPLRGCISPRVSWVGPYLWSVFPRLSGLVPGCSPLCSPFFSLLACARSPSPRCCSFTSLWPYIVAQLSVWASAPCTLPPSAPVGFVRIRTICLQLRGFYVWRLLNIYCGFRPRASSNALGLPYLSLLFLAIWTLCIYSWYILLILLSTACFIIRELVRWTPLS